MDIPVMFPPGWARLSTRPGPHRVAKCDHDDRDRAGCVLRGLSGRGGAYGDDVGLEAQTFGREGWKPLAMSVRGKIVDGDGLPIHIAQVAQALEERVKSWRPRLQRAWIERKEAEPRNFLGLLRSRRERPCRHRPTEKRYELAPSHLPPPSGQCIVPAQNNTGNGAIDVRFGSLADIATVRPMSALPPKADMCGAVAHVCFGPKADIGPASIRRPDFRGAQQPGAE